ncbi:MULTISPECIES: AAA family ATPase [Micromonospora]|uniref:AAA family ATPase n=1 Tax=Micromonospora TaxID=1873 RepID=UPI0001C465D1|nr:MULTISPECIES: AAA family ATPase [Micromonospora]ADU05568.1 ATP-binding protein [Micromonospora sp. L5]MDG4754998.1 AAA family ATPase [Micromonospora sp. WMMD718]RNI02383.1 ATPase [Micromonospora aurantiaca]SCL39549.1 Predicted ATPase [Micromonospora aurantiaca]
MPGFILTGAPGSGKTAILRHLEVDGHPVVEEAATDVIALHQALGRPEPWREPDFAERVLALQRRRRRRAEAHAGEIVFHDRSPVCTLALCRHLGSTPPSALLDEVERLTTERRHYERTVFFVRNQGFVEATAARRISFEESLVFERVHELTYRDAGFDLVEVPAGPLATRVAAIKQAVDRLRAARVRT